ncbi:MAG TPA: hypothetical protein VJH03_24505 [Blastocatellia bacterium]|nr:hypothetical protein [Blastocatellia bacterium]
MRRAIIVGTAILIQCFSVSGQAPDRLEGRWAGTVDGLQGKQSAAATFKKDGEKYTGSISGFRPGMEATLKDIKLEGDKVTARTEIETPQGSVVVNYDFVVQGDSLKGKGEVDFGGQTYTFEFDLRRGADMPSGTPAAPQSQGQTRREVPQPQQKQSAGYFVGTWSFKWVGRESPLGPAPREGTTTFTLRGDGKTLDARTEGKSDERPFTESAVITWDEETKTLAFSERLAGGVQIQSKGDWHSPIAIRFTVEPLKVKGQTLLLKRIISVVAAHSFTVTEELSENGGPFVRLGNAIYTKVIENK